MSTANLARMFDPGTIAVIGASEKKGRVGQAIVQNLITHTFEKDIFPVNPNYSNIMGIPALAKVQQIPKDIDLAIIATPISQVPKIIAACGEKNAAGAVIVSAGGKETGPKGRAIEEKIKGAAIEAGMRIIGPNCVGIANTLNGLNASFMHLFPPAGRIAFLSQSGAVCTSVLDLALAENVGFSHFVSLGSMLDVDFADMIDFLGTQPKVESIVMYMENMTHIRNFMSAARAVSRIKPIIVLKSGRSPAGARAAASHTGAMAGEDRVYDAAFKRAGILRVDEFDQLFDCARLLARQQRPRGKNLAIITNAGGPGVMAVDALARYGLEPARLSQKTIERLDHGLAKEWSRANPVDILGDATPEQYLRAAEICSRAPEVDGLLLLCSPVGTFDPLVLATPLAEWIKKVQCPVFTSWIGVIRMDEARQTFNENGGTTFDTPEKAVRAFAGLYQYGRNIDMLHEIPVRRDKKRKIDFKAARIIIEENLDRDQRFLSEVQTKALLGCYGIPVNRTKMASTPEQAAQAASQLGFPVALKISSPDIVHKSDAGGVVLNLVDAKEVRAAFARIMENTAKAFPKARIDGVCVQTMAPMGDYEIIVGAKKDDQFGPVLVFGMGGVMTEIFQDTALGLPPLNPALAREVINATKISKAIKGFRHLKAVNAEQAEEILIRTGRLVTDFPQIKELDINPLVVKDGNLMAVDARIRVEKTSTISPDHLIISPYPAWQEACFKTVDDEKIIVRPIRPDDGGPMISFFSDLSRETVYSRFFSPIKQLSKSMLIKLTQIDYDREVALVAFAPDLSGDQIIGAARVISLTDGETGEFAIVLADPWQGKGVGAGLLKRCLAFSQRVGLKTVYGLVLNENTQMRKLGKKLGFQIKKAPDSCDIELRIDLETLGGQDQGVHS
ncbi:MAG: bifunctional acetate--CoA ligase family protein/GNAT family N-acetyltransferase [Desulfobacter sp.]|nr:MAG: bifunctional acetate--CoA ligase family protein/GNAT family N-acetyltransferase [Desulfobacter sp.]